MHDDVIARALDRRNLPQIICFHRPFRLQSSRYAIQRNRNGTSRSRIEIENSKKVGMADLEDKLVVRLVSGVSFDRAKRLVTQCKSIQGAV